MSDGITDMIKGYNEYNPKIDFLEKKIKNLKKKLNYLL